MKVFPKQCFDILDIRMIAFTFIINITEIYINKIILVFVLVVCKIPCNFKRIKNICRIMGFGKKEPIRFAIIVLPKWRGLVMQIYFSVLSISGKMSFRISDLSIKYGCRTASLNVTYGSSLFKKYPIKHLHFLYYINS